MGAKGGAPPTGGTRGIAEGESADPDRDVIQVDGRPVHSEPLEYWLVHKPAGVLTTVHDPFGRRHVVDLVPERRVRLFPVGRLDLDTEGLVRARSGNNSSAVSDSATRRATSPRSAKRSSIVLS